MITGYKTPDKLGSSCLSLNVKLGSFFSFLKNYVPLDNFGRRDGSNGDSWVVGTECRNVLTRVVAAVLGHPCVCACV